MSSAGSLARLLGAGVLAGALASIVMGGGLQAAEKRGLLGMKMPPKKITEGMLGLFGVHHPDPAERDLATAAAHMGYGTAAGVVYGGLRRVLGGRVPGVISGAVFGAGVWAISYMGWVPAAKLLPPPRKDFPTRPPTMLGLHLVYGAVLGQAMDMVEPRAQDAASLTH
jgi:hypothetical protein